MFADYYKEKSSLVSPPTMINRREFGFILLKEKVMLRHKSFENSEAVKKFLATTTSSDVYYSAAYYERPDASMDEKGWLGADLVFDIDADHIPTPCGKIHDSWVCSKCSFVGRGPSPEKCPVCGEAKFDAKSWICDGCLTSAKRETFKLVNMLSQDFGFAADEVKVYFSGHRGYHVHIENEDIRLLDSMARKEIVDYIIGLGLKTELHGLIEKDRIVVEPGMVGWRGRIANGLAAFLEAASNGDIDSIGLSKRRVDFLIKNKETLQQSLKNKGWIDVKGVGPKNWKAIIQWVVDQQSAKIDTVVTTDIHRLIRLGGSIHGKTGFMKVEVPLKGLEKFDPLRDAVAFKEGQVIVNIIETPEFRIGDMTYGPFKNTRKELPTAAALFLLCKGAAQVVE